MPTIRADRLPKDSTEQVGFVFDFSRFPESMSGEDLVAVVSVEAEPPGLTVGAGEVTTAAIDGVPAGRGVLVPVGGGDAGTDYAVEVLAEFAGGNRRIVKGIIVCE
jgi:hypothetical protein